MRSFGVCLFVLSLALFAIAVIMVGSAVGQYGVMVEGPGPGGAWGFPGSNTTHSYRIWNTGNYTDTFDLNATSESGWMVMIPSDITLGPGEAQWVDVRVHIPDGTLAYTADDLTVRAVSRSAPVSDTNVSVTRVYRMADVQLSTTESPSGEPGENLTVLFTIRNRGNYDDNFTLTVSAEDTAYRNWTVSAPRRTADIAPSGERQIAVEVWIPRSTAEDIIAANTYATVKLTAMSAWDPHIEASGYANVRVRESRDVDLRIVGNETVDVQAGDTAEFVIEVTNAANHQSTDTFDLHVSTEQSDWLTIVQPNRVTLANGESTRVVLKATPPEDSEYRRCEMYVTATSSADPDRWRQVTAIALLPQRFGVDVTPLEPVLQQGRPLDILQFRFNVENQGNDADTFSLYANTTHGWATEVNRTVRLEFRGHEVVVVNVTVQAGTPTGTNEKLFLRARAGDGVTQDTAYATIEVLQGYAVDLEPQTNSTNAVPGEVKVMNLVLTNTGNGIDTFDLRVTSNVTASVDRTAVENLRASEQVPLRLTVQISEGTPAGTIIHTYVNATSRADPAATDEADAVITISQVAGVSVRNAETAHGDPGGMTTLNFTVENAGNGADTFTLAATSQSDWDLVIINPDGAEDMEAGEQRVIQVRVLIPFGLEAGLEEKITLVATSELDTKVSDEGSGICRINLVTGVSVTGRDTSFKIIPGNTLFVPVYVENTGNGREEIHIEVTSSRPGWNAWARETALSLAMGESVSVDIGIEPPSGSFSTASSIRVAASVIVDNRTVDTDTEYLDASASFVMPVERPFIYLFPGSTGSFMVRVQNLWETDTNVTIDFTPMHGWNISLDQAPTFIAPGRSEVFAVRVTAPVSLIHLDPVPVRLTVALGLGYVDTLTLDVLGLSPDLSVADLRVDGHLWEGETVRVSFLIRSIAVPTGDPEYDTLKDVPVELYIMGERVDTIRIDMPIDGSTPVTLDMIVPDLEWYQRVREVDLEVKVASRGYESINTMGDNVETHRVIVRKNTHPLAIIILPVLLVAFLVALRANQRRVSLRQRLNEHLLKGAIISTAITFLLVLPLEIDVIDASSLALTLLMLLFLIPLFSVVSGLRTKSYVGVTALVLLMFFILFLAMSSGHDPASIVGSLTDRIVVDESTGDALPLPTALLLVVPVIAGMIAVYVTIRLLDSALSAYNQAKALVEAVKREVR